MPGEGTTVYGSWAPTPALRRRVVPTHTGAHPRLAVPAKALWALGSAVPKALVPPFRVIYPSDPLTNPLSVGAHAINRIFAGSEAAEEIASGLRSAGRVISPVATPLTLGEGAWDWGALVYCAFGD
jgi:hypothetical protein